MFKGQGMKVLQKAERFLFQMVRNKVQKFILCAAFCITLFAGVLPETSTQMMPLNSAEGGFVITSVVRASENEAWIGETARNSSLLRAQFRFRNDERRVNRLLTLFYLFVSVVLPGLFLSIYKVLYYFGERFVGKSERIIRFIHDLDGRKRITV